MVLSAENAEEAESTALEGTFFFDPNDSIYTEHFPGNPVVPGSVIIGAFLFAAERLGHTAGGSVRDFKFRRFISPGEYRYSMETAGSDLKCRLFDGGIVVTTGVLGQ